MEEVQVKKYEIKQQTYAQSKSSMLRLAIFWGGGTKKDPRWEATGREEGSNSGSHIGRRTASKMSKSASRATIWR